MIALPVTLPVTTAAQGPRPAAFDVIIQGGDVYHGTGRPPVRRDVGITGDRIAAIGDLKGATATTIIDAKGLAVAPGFINMLSHSEVSLIVDGRSMSEIKQGITTQIFGEFSMGPLNDEMKRRIIANQGDVKFDIQWTTLSEYLTWLEKRGISQNVASFMSEENIKMQIRQPWVTFGSDGSSMAPEGVFLKSSTHPRSYGNFARLLGKYVREEEIITLTEAVRRLSGLPAMNLGLAQRGLLKRGMFADVVVLDPRTIGDRATFERPDQYSIGVKHVLVNGAHLRAVPHGGRDTRPQRLATIER